MNEGIWPIPEDSGGGTFGPQTGGNGGWGGTADAWDPHGTTPSYGFVISGVATNHDPIGAAGNPAGAVASHYYQSYWAGVQGALYGFGGALAGAAMFGAFAPEAAAFEIIATGAHIGAMIAQHFFAAAGGGGGGANDNRSSAGSGGGPFGDDVVDEQGIIWRGFGPGGPGGLALPGAVWEPLGDKGLSDLNPAELARVNALQTPNALHAPLGAFRMKEWLYATFPMAGALPTESNLFFDFERANSVITKADIFLWNMNIEQSRVPVYSPTALVSINDGYLIPEDPIGSYVAAIGYDGFIRTDTSTILPFGIPVGYDYGPFGK